MPLTQGLHGPYRPGRSGQGADAWGHPGAKLMLLADGKVVITDGTNVTWST